MPTCHIDCLGKAPRQLWRAEQGGVGGSVASFLRLNEPKREKPKHHIRLINFFKFPGLTTLSFHEAIRNIFGICNYVTKFGASPFGLRNVICHVAKQLIKTLSVWERNRIIVAYIPKGFTM